MPDKEVMDEQEPDIRVEVVPEPEEEKPRMKAGATSKLDMRDEEISEYGKEVQDRIKKLRFAFHEEKRQREQKERDLVTTTDYAQRLHRENLELKKSVQKTEQAVVHQAMSRVDAEIAQARQSNLQALQAGHAGDIVAAGEKLARAVAEKERLALLRADPEEEPAPAAPPPQQQQPDPRYAAWVGRNPWWQKPGHEKRTGYAVGVHNELVARGVNPVNQPDLYWKTIDEELGKVFPDQSTNGNGHNEEDREEPGPRPLAVAGGTRSNTGASGKSPAGARVIRLSESQVRLARRIGLTPEQYAHQLALEQGVANG